MTEPSTSGGWSDPTSPPAPIRPSSFEPDPVDPADLQWQRPPDPGTVVQPYYLDPHQAYETPTQSFPHDPYAYPQTVQAYPGAAYGPPVYVIAQPTNSLAIASMILSICGLGPIGAIMGHVARKQIRQTGDQGEGFALAGIIIGWITTGLVVLCCASQLLLLGLPFMFFGILGTGGG